MPVKSVPSRFIDIPFRDFITRNISNILPLRTTERSRIRKDLNQYCQIEKPIDYCTRSLKAHNPG